VVRFDEMSKIHAIKLITRKNQYIVGFFSVDVGNVLPYGISGSLIPIGAFVGLLGGEYLDETLAEHVKFIGVGNMAVQTHRKKLCEHIYGFQATIDTVGDGYINQPVFASYGDGGFRSGTGQRKQAGTSTSSQNQCQYLAHSHLLRTVRANQAGLTG